MPLPAFLSSSRNRWLIAALVVTASLLTFMVLRTPTKAAQVLTVQRADLTQTVAATGRVNASARIDLGSEVTATVLAVAVREGDRVKAGELLVRLNDTEAQATLAQAEAALSEARARQAQLGSVASPVAQANLQQAEATLRAAEAEHHRATELVAQGFFSQQKLDDARRLRDTARSALASARSQAQAQQPGGAEGVLAATRLVQAQAAVEAARARLARLQLRSPLDAVVLTRTTEPGNLAQPGKVLLSLAASGALRLDVAVDEKHLSLLRNGLPARAVADAYALQPFDAALDWVSPAVDPARGTVEVRLRVPQPPAFLKPDMTVSVDMTVGQVAQALVVDAGAVRGADTATPWALVLNNGVATRTQLTLGLRGTGVMEVKSGLAEGDAVVPATEKVAEGDRVKPTQKAPVRLSGSGMGR
jgi:HlyD family secretion protein